jgi:hypothetical protein
MLGQLSFVDARDSGNSFTDRPARPPARPAADDVDPRRSGSVPAREDLATPVTVVRYG